MRRHVRWAAFIAAGLLWTLGGRAAQNNNLTDSVQKISAAFDKKDMAGAKKMADDAAKKIGDFEDVMHLFALRTKKDLGVGGKAGAVTPDGIEKKIETLADKGIPADKLPAEADALAQMGNDLAALGELTIAKKPGKDEGKKKAADWVKWATDMRDAGVALADAAKKKDAAALKKAADKANTSCTKCHDVFRYE